MNNRWTIDERNNFPVYHTCQTDVDLANRIYHDKFAQSNTLNSKTVYNRQESRIAGILGEIVFGRYLEDNYKYVGMGDVPFDFIFNDKKIDVKCKYRTVFPRTDFEASFFAYQCSSRFSQVDYYAFLSTMTDFRKFWFCGYISKKDWIKNPKGKLWKRGETDPSNKKRFDEDTWSVFYRDIPQFKADPFDCFV
jgi:hypothetical protein